jgi:isocitrate dehydrogenase
VGRLLASFPDNLKPAQRQSDDLAELGELAKTPEANIIKLPNISASGAAAAGDDRGARQQGYRCPRIPRSRRTTPRRRQGALRQGARQRGEPVLREGNSDRRVAPSVKRYARKHPHSMGRWSKDSKTHVASMGGGDFYSSEQSAVVQKSGKLKIELTSNRGEKTVLKDGVSVKEGDVIAASVLNRRALRDFFTKQIADAKAKGLLLSLHLKATMMKVSDPIMFGHAVEVYYQDVFTKPRRRAREARRRAEQRHRRPVRQDQGAAGGRPGRDRSGLEGSVRDSARARDGRLEQGHHELARAERHHHRRSMPAAIRSSGQMWGRTASCTTRRR